MVGKKIARAVIAGPGLSRGLFPADTSRPKRDFARPMQLGIGPLEMMSP